MESTLINPELPGGRPREEVIEAWFNVAAFANPASGADGNSRRNLIDGPPLRTIDFGLFRDIRLGGPVLQFRLEGTNIFNIVNLSNPGTNLNAPATFGKIRSARDMRRLQIGLRLGF